MAALLRAMQNSAPNRVGLAAGFPRRRFCRGNSYFESQVLLEPRVANAEIADSPGVESRKRCGDRVLSRCRAGKFICTGFIRGGGRLQARIDVCCGDGHAWYIRTA